jgi:hypothetical protein
VITDTAFGKIVSSTGFPRQMQFGLHLRWGPRHHLTWSGGHSLR